VLTSEDLPPLPRPEFKGGLEHFPILPDHRFRELYRNLA
jgi:hypothetical protein